MMRDMGRTIEETKEELDENEERGIDAVDV